MRFYFHVKKTPQVQVLQVNEQKHLGLILENDLSFERHLEEKIRKAKKNFGILKHLSKFLPLKTLDQMYKALTRFHLDYCNLIYHIPPTLTQTGLTLHNLMEKVERIQYQATLAITGAWQGSRSKIYEELGWETLSDRRLIKGILQIHKIIDDKTPSYLKDKLPPNRLQFLSNVFRDIRCRTDRYRGASSQMQFLLGMKLLHTLNISRRVKTSISIFIPIFVLYPSLFLVCMIQMAVGYFSS